MRLTFFKGVVLGATTSVLVLLAASAVAGTGIGAVFNLGQTNTVDATSILTGNSAGPQLRVVNANAANPTVQGEAGGGSGVALLGVHTTAAGAGAAVRGETASTAASATALFGLVSSPTPGADATAVRGQNIGNGGAGFGVWGSHAGSGFGVYGSTGQGTGVTGAHLGSSGLSPGVKGVTNSTDPNAVAIVAQNSGGGSALDLVVGNGAPPLKVNSAIKVVNLNADLLDGQDSTAFLPVGGKAADSNLLDGRDSTSFAGSTMYVRTMTTDGSANASSTCPSGDLCYAGGYYCDVGDTLVGGGFAEIDNGTRLVASEPFVPNPQDTWRIKFVNNSTEDTIVVYTMCLDNPPAH